MTVKDIESAYQNILSIAERTPLQYSPFLSDRFDAQIYLKREDLQITRSYKLRGAYNKISKLAPDQIAQGIVCASAGNHAQGVAYVCHKLRIKGTIFMPNPTPRQKINKVKRFGKSEIDIVLTGDTYDDAYAAALNYQSEHGAVLIPPFDDPDIISGQGTVGLEILLDAAHTIDYVVAPIGGGGLCAGVGTYISAQSPKTKLIGVEPQGAAAMKTSITQGKLKALKEIDVFVDGAAVKTVGQLSFAICQEVLSDIILVDEGHVCSTILELYNEEAIVAEPAGVMSISALDHLTEQIRGKTVVCILSGGNNDITRMEEIKERSLLYKGLKHYFIIRFPQRSGALRDFLNNVLSADEDISHFEYTKKHNRDRGPALVGLELKRREDYESLIRRMDEHDIDYETLNDNQRLFELLV